MMKVQNSQIRKSKIYKEDSLKLSYSMLIYFKNVNKAFFLSWLLKLAYDSNSDEVAIQDVEWEEFQLSTHEVRNIRKELIDQGIVDAKRKWSDFHGANVYHYKLNFQKIEDLLEHLLIGGKD